MKRIFPLMALFVVALVAGGAGCSSDPNVEGAKLDLRNQDYTRALENINTALSKNPENAEAHELKGRILQAQAETVTDPDQHEQLIRDMVASYDRAVQLDPNLAEGVRMQKLMAYAQEYERGVQAYNRGRNDPNEFNTAARIFGNAALIQPDSAGAYVNQAYALVSAQRQSDAIAPLRMAVERGDRSPDTYIYLASLLMETGDTAEAVSVLERANQMMPDNQDIQTQLLSAYVAAGQTDRAIQSYAAQVQADPENALYRYNYGSLLLQAERYDDAVEQLQVAVRVAPDNANAQYNLGAAYINQAVAVNERIQELDDRLREERRNLTSAQIQEREREIAGLVEQRTALFRQAVPALEQARTLNEAAGQPVTEICRALFQSYANSGQSDRAQSVASCAGYDDTN